MRPLIKFSIVECYSAAMHAVIFDIDGTLLKSASVDDELYRSALQRVLGPMRFRESLSDYDHVSDSGILAQVIDDNQFSALQSPAPQIISYFVESLQNYITSNGPFLEIPGARRFLKGLRASPKHYVALATGGWRASAILKLESADFDLDGIGLFTSDQEYDRSRIMLSALDRPESDYSSITYYGDGPWDRTACKRLGWKFVAVGRSLGGLESYEGHP